MIDTDSSHTIDKEETLKFWSKNFPKLNSNELFAQVDKNQDGSIQLNEWLDFWVLVLQAGHSEEEISSEVNLFKEIFS
jgi:Ca2+-binding EF-hand superfamily protein